MEGKFLERDGLIREVSYGLVFSFVLSVLVIALLALLALLTLRIVGAFSAYVATHATLIAERRCTRRDIMSRSPAYFAFVSGPFGQISFLGEEIKDNGVFRLG